MSTYNDNRMHFGRYSPIPDSKISQVIYTVYNTFKRDDGSVDKSWDNMVVCICNNLNISKEECYECVKKEEEKEDCCRRDSSLEKFSDLDSNCIALIRRHIHDYYVRGEHPSRNDILDSLNADNLYHGTILELRHIVKKLGFTYGNVEGKMLLWERNKLVIERGNFLETVHERRLDNIVWVSETFIRIKQSVTDEQVMKEWKVIVLLAATVEGFIDEVSLVYATEDYIDEELYILKFTDWFEERLLPILDGDSIIVLENSNYHKHVFFNEAPTDDALFTEDDIRNWLKRNLIEFDKTLTKVQLINLVDINKSLVPRYTIDYTAKLFGIEVLRYPSYHNHFSPFELIFSKIKNNITQYNCRVNSSTDAVRLLYESIAKITKDDWSNAIDETNAIIEEAWRYEALLDMAKDSIRAKLQESNSAEEDSEQDCDESVSELSDESTQYSYDTDINGEWSDSTDSI